MIFILQSSNFLTHKRIIINPPHMVFDGAKEEDLCKVVPVFGPELAFVSLDRN